MATALALAGPACAQTVPLSAQRSLWCASAFSLTSEQLSADARRRMAKSGETLLARAQLELLQAGFSDAQVASLAERVEAEVMIELGSGGRARFSFEDCRALLESDP